MSAGKRKLNKAHPDCAAYTEKFNALWDTYSKREEEELAKYPDYKGLDHPAYAVLRPLHRKLSEDIKDLQKEYDYLFTDGQGKT